VFVELFVDVRYDNLLAAYLGADDTMNLSHVRLGSRQADPANLAPAYLLTGG
jgi:hypothetical protein